MVLFFSLLAAVAADDFPDAGSQSTTHERTNNEYPQVRQCLTTLEQSRAN